MRLGVLATHPIQYHAPLYRALAREVDLDVFFAHRQTAAGQAAAGFGVAFEWDVPLTDGYRHTFLENRSRRPSTDTFAGTNTPDVAGHIRRGRYDAFLVNGWYTRSLWQAIVACWRTGTPVLVRGDSHLGTARSGLRRAAKEVAYRAFVPRFDGYLVVGELARDYLLHYGADPARMDRVPHFVDAEYFRARATASDRAATRASFGAGPDETVLLFAGKLLDVKRPSDLIEAAAVLRARGRAVRVVVVGSGALEADLRAQASRLGVPAHFAGFRNQSELPAYYAAADLLVLPSEGETWGLVVNEALACGTPAVVSDRVGCAPDLIVDADAGRTGAVFPFGDPAALADAVERVIPSLGSPALAEALTRTTAAYSLEAAVEGTLRAVRRVRRTREPVGRVPFLPRPTPAR
jgi:glycosyltransferase involved in cell wall biosynthesis